MKLEKSKPIEVIFNNDPAWIAATKAVVESLTPRVWYSMERRERKEILAVLRTELWIKVIPAPPRKELRYERIRPE